MGFFKNFMSLIVWFIDKVFDLIKFNVKKLFFLVIVERNFLIFYYLSVWKVWK